MGDDLRLLTPEEIFTMDPEELAGILKAGIEFPEVTGLDTPEERREAQEALQRCSAYLCYFEDVLMRIRIRKRAARAMEAGDAASKREKKAEVDALMSLEDVFESLRRIADTQLTYITKLMTIKRLGLDDAKILGNSQA